jgi:hypothetical protein
VVKLSNLSSSAVMVVNRTGEVRLQKSVGYVRDVPRVFLYNNGYLLPSESSENHIEGESLLAKPKTQYTQFSCKTRNLWGIMDLDGNEIDS